MDTIPGDFNNVDPSENTDSLSGFIAENQEGNGDGSNSNENNADIVWIDKGVNSSFMVPLLHPADSAVTVIKPGQNNVTQCITISEPPCTATSNVLTSTLNLPAFTQLLSSTSSKSKSKRRTSSSTLSSSSQLSSVQSNVLSSSSSSTSTVPSSSGLQASFVGMPSNHQHQQANIGAETIENSVSDILVPSDSTLTQQVQLLLSKVPVMNSVVHKQLLVDPSENTDSLSGFIAENQEGNDDGSNSNENNADIVWIDKGVNSSFMVPLLHPADSAVTVIKPGQNNVTQCITISEPPCTATSNVLTSTSNLPSFTHFHLLSSTSSVNSHTSSSNLSSSSQLSSVQSSVLSSSSSSTSTVPSSSGLQASFAGMPSNHQDQQANIGAETIENSVSGDILDPSDSTLTQQDKLLLSKVPVMNSVVHNQLLELLKNKKLRDILDPEHAQATKRRPIAVLTSYRVKTISCDDFTEHPAATYSKGHWEVLKPKKPSPEHPMKLIYQNFLPITCEHLSAVIHLNKMYCPGTHRPCVEFEGTLISPFDLLKRAGYTYTTNWQVVFRVRNGKSVKMLFLSKKLKFRSHHKFCSGLCPKDAKTEQPYPLVASVLADLRCKSLNKEADRLRHCFKRVVRYFQMTN